MKQAIEGFLFSFGLGLALALVFTPVMFLAHFLFR
jgi:hypothetical protein